MEGSKRTATRIGHLYFSKKTIHQIALSSLWLQTVGKPVALVAEMEQQLNSKKSRTVDNMLL